MHWEDESKHFQCSGSLPPLPGDYGIEAVTFGIIILATKINLLRWKNNKPPSRVKTHLPRTPVQKQMLAEPKVLGILLSPSTDPAAFFNQNITSVFLVAAGERLNKDPFFYCFNNSSLSSSSSDVSRTLWRPTPVALTTPPAPWPAGCLWKQKLSWIALRPASLLQPSA